MYDCLRLNEFLYGMCLGAFASLLSALHLLLEYVVLRLGKRDGKRQANVNILGIDIGTSFEHIGSNGS